ncbi:MAG: F0F1 ATP synthase subunit delta [Gammaproteobacteria bacterium]|nr:F0F1 ATP synthase subunit delta [Gammaproteobacteria bacterium]
MQENLTIARPYAQAAFEYSNTEGAIGAWSEALAFLGMVVADPAMRRVISDPKVSQQRLIDLLLDLGGARFSPSFGRFVKVLGAAHRLVVVGEIAQLFERHRAVAENIAHAEIVSAFPLAPSEEAAIAKAVEKRLGKAVRITQRLDQTLIGGAIVQVGDTVFDVSLKGGLNQLANLFNWK